MHVFAFSKVVLGMGATGAAASLALLGTARPAVVDAPILELVLPEVLPLLAEHTPRAAGDFS